MIPAFLPGKWSVMKMREPDYVIWDFNGTILDDVQTGIDSVNLLLRTRNLPEIPDVEAYRRVFGFPIQSYYQRLGFDFTKEPYEAIAVEWVNEYLRNVSKAPLCTGVLETLEFFRSRGISQVVLSATKLDMLETQLVQLGLRDFFEEIMGLDNIYAVSKAQLAASWRGKHPDASVLMLGDTVHDVEVANLMRAACILVEGGHQARSVLEADGATVVHNLFEIISLFS